MVLIFIVHDIVHIAQTGPQEDLLLWHSTEAVAFFSPRPLPYFPCLLSRLVSSHLLRDSLCIALQTGKIMDLINWSLNAIDTNLIFSAPLNQHWPRPRPLLENQPWEEHCSETLLRSSPILQTPADYKLLHIHTVTAHNHFKAR